MIIIVYRMYIAYPGYNGGREKESIKNDDQIYASNNRSGKQLPNTWNRNPSGNSTRRCPSTVRCSAVTEQVSATSH